MSASIIKKLQKQKETIIKTVSLLEDTAKKASSPITDEEYETLTYLLEDATPLGNKLDDIANELFELEVDIQDELLSFKSTYARARGLAKLKLRSRIQQSQPSTSPPTSEPRTKLPEVNIPTFNGEYANWTSFKDSFTSLIHENASLSNVQRFHYLRNALTGEAASILKCLQISDAGYDAAWAQLHNRYQNERFLVQKLVQTLLNLPAMKKNDCVSLRNLIDTVSITIAALTKLQRPVHHWDDMLIELISGKLDSNLHDKWEGDTCNKVPSFQDLDIFLNMKCKQLEAIRNNSYTSNDKQMSHKTKVLHVNTSDRRCSFCKQDHVIYRCDKFISLSVSERLEAAKKHSLCFNCLGNNHVINKCMSKSVCRKCNKKHHSLLHLQQTQSPSTQSPVASVSSTPVSSAINFTYTPSRVLLSTCKVVIKDSSGNEHFVRAVLDTGSQANLITESCAKRLGLKQKNINTPIVGVGGKTKTLEHAVSVLVKSRVSNFKVSLCALVINRITDRIPARLLEFEQVNISPEIELADPEFYEPQDIDLLIGNAHYHDITCDGRLHLNSISLYNTHFGWVVYGEMPYKNTRQDKAVVSLLGINELVTKFWELENHKGETLSPADERCEDHFRETVKRDIAGRFEVALPFKENPARLGDSSESAKRRFFALERRLAKSPNIYSEYRAFMLEYETLGHMKKTVGDVKQGFYLPHHCVLKQSSLTTKLRVVFNGSAPTTNGISLNDILMVGPPVQNDLFSIMVRMRSWNYVITADIAKMYRQVNVRPADQQYQRIWWRQSPEHELTSYELTTVTYGTAPAAYLAIRALRELAERERKNYPIGSKKCTTDFYVDDLITGANTLDELKQVRDQVNALLSSGGFELKRWASNHNTLFKDFKTECSDNITVLTRDSDECIDTVTTLGTVWNTKNDSLSYKCSLISTRATTKRNVLSELSRVYDPLGLIGPITILGKVFIQDLWKLKCGWDDALPAAYIQRWLDYFDNLKLVSLINIPRMVITQTGCDLEIHGFSDASEHAYGACVYVVGTQFGKGVFSNLLCAKSRVAPVKATSIPRLELCAAVLLAELCNRVRETLSEVPHKTYYYSDSTITLSWIKSDSRRFKTFVANRIGTIHQYTNPAEWFHVSTKENPADIISRGASAEELNNNDFWWRGPAFLLTSRPQDNFIPADSPPEVKCNVATITEDNVVIPECSTFEKTVRVMAYVLRFKDNLIARSVVHSGQLTIKDLNQAKTVLLLNVQRVHFNRELQLLKRNLSVQSSSKLIKLNPFLDSNGIIRVGGRLIHAEISVTRRFPIVLPTEHRVTKLIVASVHQANLHIGAQGTLAAMRLQFWPISGRKLVRGVLRTCLNCIRAKPQFQAPLMGALPPIRTHQSRPFLRSGVDYCGPFLIKDGSRRSKRTVKAYICIFVCCSTKAVHIELVSNLSTDCFLAAFARFISRRGCVSEIISDNGTNFVGARNYLRELGLFLLDPKNSAALTAGLMKSQVKWTFIPPRAPHFGGLWEAAVKSVKTHLHRVAGKALLTAEEMCTLLAQIEAVLNSRPLCPLTEDPNDCDALTPAHFLIGDVLTSPVEQNLKDIPDNRLSRWQLIEKMRQHIWKRWSREYLSELHTRGKWNRQSDLPKEGQLVIVKDDNLPPLQWQLGRIEKLHLGPDGIPRSAVVKTAVTSMLRPLVKLCLLPIS